MGHKLQMYENLLDMLDREISEIERKHDLDEKSLDNLYKLCVSSKAIMKRIAYEEGQEAGKSMSYDGYSMARGRDAMGRYTSRDGQSMDGMSNAMRPYWMYDGMSRDYSNAMPKGADGDNDGRHGESKDNFRYSQDRGGSYTDGTSHGYSRDASKKKMVKKLETLMDDTMSEKERQAIQRCMNEIES